MYIKASGDANKMASALKFDNNLKDIKRRNQSSGLIFNFEAGKEVTIAAFDGSFILNNVVIKD